MRRYHALSLFPLLLAACVGVVAQGPVAAGGRSVCEDGKTFLVELVQNGATAEVTSDNRTLALMDLQIHWEEALLIG